MSLGKTIRCYREEMGVSQAQLAAGAALSQGYLSQIENDEVQNPSAAVLFRLAQALHIDPNNLLAAAGYPDVAGNGEREAFETMVDPDLLAFLARLSPEQQLSLLHFLHGLEDRAPSLVTVPAPKRVERQRVGTK